MATVIYPSPIFGPVHSRRLGVSLGINLLPEDGKWCTFDCVYCECGFNKDFRPKKPLPTREEVRTALEERLKSMSANGPVPDVLTFAGNGEPTLHPHFAEIIEDTRALRDRYFPKAKISVLSNATQIFRPEVLIQKPAHQHAHTKPAGVCMPRQNPESDLLQKLRFVFSKYLRRKSIAHRPVIDIGQKCLQRFHAGIVILHSGNENRMKDIFIVINVGKLL